LYSQNSSSQDQNVEECECKSSNVECENMMAEHEEVLAAELVVTTKRQDMTQWQCMRKYWHQRLNW
jgi:hypothetical protein